MIIIKSYIRLYWCVWDLTGVQECSGADHQLCLRDVLSPPTGPTHPVHLRPHGVLSQYKWPH